MVPRKTGKGGGDPNTGTLFPSSSVSTQAAAGMWRSQGERGWEVQKIHLHLIELKGQEFEFRAHYREGAQMRPRSKVSRTQRGGGDPVGTSR